MSEQKPISVKKSTMSTGGCGALLSLLVGALFTDPNSHWRTLAYALVPGLAALLTYLMNWAIARHGLESPEDAAKRALYKRDLKEIEKQLSSENMTPGMKKKLLTSKDRTIGLLVSIGSDKNVPVNVPFETAKPKATVKK